MARLRDAVQDRRPGQDVWFIMRVIRYNIRYLATDCASFVDMSEEVYATLDREQAFALAKQVRGLVLRFDYSGEDVHHA